MLEVLKKKFNQNFLQKSFIKKLLKESCFLKFKIIKFCASYCKWTISTFTLSPNEKFKKMIFLFIYLFFFLGNHSRTHLDIEENLFGCSNVDSWNFYISLQGFQQNQLWDVTGDSNASHRVEKNSTKCYVST